MRKILTIITFLISSLFFNFAANAQKTPLPVAAIMQFDIKGNVNLKDAGKTVAEWLSTSIAKTGKYSVLDKLLLKSTLLQQEISSNELLDKSNLPKIGKTFGAQVIITGKIIELNKLFILSAKITDVETGKTIGFSEYKTDDNQTFQTVMDKFAQVLTGLLPASSLNEEEKKPQLEKKLMEPIGIKILKIQKRDESTEFILNAGLDSGLKIGDFYEIYSPSFEKSPVSGKISFTGIEKSGLIEIISLEQTHSIGKLIYSQENLESKIEQSYLLPVQGKSFLITVFTKKMPDIDLGLGLSLSYTLLKWEFFTSFSYPREFEIGAKYHVLGISPSNFRLSVGTGIGIGEGHDYTYLIYNQAMPLFYNTGSSHAYRLFFNPFLEVSLSSFFIQVGASLYGDIQSHNKNINGKINVDYNIGPFFRFGHTF